MRESPAEMDELFHRMVWNGASHVYKLYCRGTSGVKFLRRDQLPRLAQVRRKFLITHTRKLDTYPTCDANIRRSIKLLRIGFDQCCLNADSCGYRHCDVPVVMMIDRAHRKHSFLHEERRLAVRELFPRFRQREAEAANPFDMFLTGRDLAFCGLVSFIATVPSSIRLSYRFCIICDNLVLKRTFVLYT